MLILRDWLDIIGGTLLVGSPIIYTVFGKRFYEKWLDHRFLAEHERMKLALNKDFEAYKQSLLDEAEHIKANHRRALQHFSLYVTKKHDVYPELYKLLTLAHGKVMHLEEGNAVPVEHMDIAELQRVLEELHVPAVEREDLLSLRDTSTDSEFFAAVKRSIQVQRDRTAHAARNDATTYFMVNELYCSENVRVLARKCLATLIPYQIALVCEPESISRYRGDASQALTAVQRALTDEIQTGANSADVAAIVKARIRGS